MLICMYVYIYVAKITSNSTGTLPPGGGGFIYYIWYVCMYNTYIIHVSSVGRGFFLFFYFFLKKKYINR